MIARGLIQSRRMVVPNQIWMLQRIQAAMAEADRESLGGWLSRFDRGPELLALGDRLSACRIRKEGGRLFSS